MPKTLKFATDLIPLVLSGQKTSTWRLWDEKDLAVGDEVSLLDQITKQQFATAKIIKVIEKPLGELTEYDKKGHEKFANSEEMYQTYTKYYNRPVDQTTIVKIIWFELDK